MPKLLIIAACLINFGDDNGGIHHDAGDMPDVPKAPATDLVRRGRALYTSKADDADKAGRYTASPAMIAAAEAMATAKAKAAKAAKAAAKPDAGSDTAAAQASAIV